MIVIFVKEGKEDITAEQDVFHETLNNVTPANIAVSDKPYCG